MKIRSLSALGFLCLLFLACEPTYTYDSIWRSVYGTIPPYQAKLEALKLEKE